MTSSSIFKMTFCYHLRICETIWSTGTSANIYKTCQHIFLRVIFLFIIFATTWDSFNWLYRLIREFLFRQSESKTSDLTGLVANVRVASRLAGKRIRLNWWKQFPTLTPDTLQRLLSRAEESARTIFPCIIYSPRFSMPVARFPRQNRRRRRHRGC